jgi:pimeloyl-ACP methyl ester carboxylesterase
LTTLRHSTASAQRLINAAKLWHSWSVNLDYLKTGADRADLERAIDAAKEKPWYPAIDIGRVMPTEATRAKWAWVSEHDPIPDMLQLKIPTLVVIGGRDRPALAETADQKWRSAMKDAGNHDATVVVFVDAGHGATIAGTHHVGGAPPTFVPGYLEIVDAWLAAHYTTP